MRATVRVERVHKGEVPPIVVLRSYRHDSICGAGEELRAAAAGRRSLRFDIAPRPVMDWIARELAISFCEVRY